MRKQQAWQLVAAGLLTTAALPYQAQAADIMVDGTTCTLANAITSANNNADTGGCVASGTYGDDTITLNGDVTLTEALPPISSFITILGNGNTINGNGDTESVLKVNADSGLNLDSATVTGGNTSGSGGGIYNKGSSTLTGVTVTGNTANLLGGGIENTGAGSISLINCTVSNNMSFFYGGGLENGGNTVTLINSTVSDNTAAFGGGGIANDGTLFLNNSTVSSNTASGEDGGGIINDDTVTLVNSTISGNTSGDDGGGITNYGPLTMIGSTISDNTAADDGGGIDNYATLTITNSLVSNNTATEDGGGIGNTDAQVTLTNSTVSGNKAAYYGGGIDNLGGILTLTHATVSGNTGLTGGGVNNRDGSVELISSLVSGNTGTTGKELHNKVGSTATADSSNLFGHSGETTAEAFLNFLPGTNDINATSDGTNVALAALLNTTLANHGGLTQTHALVPNSPAIDLDAACSTGLSEDQRGFTRPIGASCDAGAFEYDASTTDNDGDGIYDADDNCPLVANPGQEDSNHNGIGNACEPKKSKAPLYKLLLLKD